MTLDFQKALPLILAAAAALLAGSGQAASSGPFAPDGNVRAASSGRFRPDGTVVYDANTGLSWEQSPQTTERTLSGALAYCAGLGTSFRLPNVKELQTVVDRSRSSPAVDTRVFETVVPVLYWTSTPHADQPSDQWMVEFGAGVSTFAPSASSRLTWCVRSPAQAAR